MWVESDRAQTRQEGALLDRECIYDGPGVSTNLGGVMAQKVVPFWGEVPSLGELGQNRLVHSIRNRILILFLEVRGPLEIRGGAN